MFFSTMITVKGRRKAFPNFGELGKGSEAN